MYQSAGLCLLSAWALLYAPLALGNSLTDILHGSAGEGAYLHSALGFCLLKGKGCRASIH